MPFRASSVKGERYVNGSEIVDMSMSDSYGEGLFYIQLYDPQYSYILERDGETLLVNDPAQQTNTEIEFRVRLKEDYLAGFEEIQNVPTWLTYNQNTGMVVFTWNDNQNIVETACLKIYSVSLMRGKQTIYTSCLSTQTGSISYNMSGEADGHYFVEVWLDTNTGHSWYNTKLTELILGGTMRYGLTGVLLALLVIGAITFFGLRTGNAATTTLLLVVSFIFTWALGILPLKFTAIIFLIVMCGLLWGRKRN